jgi:hypothetical protein
MIHLSAKVQQEELVNDGLLDDGTNEHLVMFNHGRGGVDYRITVFFCWVRRCSLLRGRPPPPRISYEN